MSKKKKNNNAAIMNKEMLARQRNLYLKRLHAILVGLGKEEVYKMMSQSLKAALFRMKFRPIKVTVQKEIGRTPLFAKASRHLIMKLYHDQTVSFENPDYAIKIGDYNEIFFPFLAIIDDLKESRSYKEVAKIREELADLYSEVTPNGRDAMNEKVEKVLNQCQLIYSISTCYFERMFFLEEKCLPCEPPEQPCLGIEIQQIKPDKRKFLIDGKTRSAYHLGWLYQNVEFGPTSISLGELDPKASIPDLRLDVYIQRHAIQRVYERLDCVSLGASQMILCTEIINKPEVIFYKGKTLIAVTMGKIKFGYLVVTLIDGVVLIKTFLLITSSGTPEGDKLQALTGLDKSDKSYLGLDRLSSFYSDDIKSNDKVMRLLDKIGCGRLPDIKNHIPDSGLIKCEQQTALMLEKYLKTSDVEKQDWSNLNVEDLTGILRQESEIMQDITVE
ncbi:MAG: hypothetical protein Q8909_06675 [Bacteroidota bacterium]|nr:hypothetical protein [Bacteroidota bacterium]